MAGLILATLGVGVEEQIADERKSTMLRQLSSSLTTWLAALRRIAELHPAVGSAAIWSAPRERPPDAPRR